MNCNKLYYYQMEVSGSASSFTAQMTIIDSSSNVGQATFTGTLSGATYTFTRSGSLTTHTELNTFTQFTVSSLISKYYFSFLL